MTEKIHLNIAIPAELSGSRLDSALAQLMPSYSRARIQQWIKEKQITVDGKPATPKQKVYGFEAIAVDAVCESMTDWQPEAIDLDIVFEDDQILIVNKPAGLVVHPAAGNFTHTLVNALLYHCPNLAALPRAGLVHRIDKDTTGLLAVAKTLEAHTHLVKQLAERTLGRDYLALVSGIMTPSGTVDAPIGRHPLQRTKMAVNENGKLAITHYQRLKQFPSHAYVGVSLETGRTHQIRVHLAHIKHPIIGDPVYGGLPRYPKSPTPTLRAALDGFKRQALHATRLRLQHPVTLETLTFDAPLPADMQHLLNELEQHASET